MVWDVNINPLVFKSRWNELIDMYGFIERDAWLEEMYMIGEFWIPTYYKDSSMSG